MVGRLDCESCKAKYKIGPWDSEKLKKEKAKGPKCETCKPLIHADNAMAYGVYGLCSDQWIMGMSGPVGLRLEAIESACRLFRVPADERPETVEKVIYLSRRITKRLSEKKDA